MKIILLFSISFYQKIKKYLPFPATCRYTPSCSAYTYAAVEKYGIIKGSWLGIKRIIRCTPWARGGFDPIP